MMAGQIMRALGAARSVLRDELFVNIPAPMRPLAACEMDDASLVAWVRWALAKSNAFYVDSARKKERSLAEVTTQHGVIALALLTLSSGATKATFDVDGVTFRGIAKGDWRVTIERIAEPESIAPTDTTLQASDSRTGAE